MQNNISFLNFQTIDMSSQRGQLNSLCQRYAEAISHVFVCKKWVHKNWGCSMLEWEAGQNVRQNDWRWEREDTFSQNIKWVIWVRCEHRSNNPLAVVLNSALNQVVMKCLPWFVQSRSFNVWPPADQSIYCSLSWLAQAIRILRFRFICLEG